MVGMAAMFRVTEASGSFRALAQQVTEQPNDLAARLFPRPPAWAKDSIMMNLMANREKVQSVAPFFLVAPLHDLQSRLYRQLRSLKPSPWEALLQRRAERHFDRNRINTQTIMANIRRANVMLPDKLVFATLRVLCNGLPTSRRLQLGVLNCRFCGGEDGDCIEHLIHCGPLIIFLCKLFPCIDGLLGPVLGVSRSLLNRSLSRDELIATVVGHDLLVHGISALHLGWRDARPEEIFSGRIRALCRRTPAVAKILRDHR